MFRSLAEMYPNTYSIIVFACCRELYDLTRHSGCFGGTREEAKLAYDKKMSQIKSDTDQAQKLSEEFIKLRQIQIKYDELINAN